MKTGSNIKNNIEQTLGISISNDAIRIACAQKQGNNFVITHGHVIRLNTEEVKSGGDQVISQQIQAYLKSAGITQNEVYLDVAGENVTTHQLPLTPMPEKELSSAIQMGLENIYGQGYKEEYYWDAIELQHTYKSQILILAVMVKRMYLDRLLKIVMDADLTPVGVEFTPLAFWKAVRSHFLVEKSADQENFQVSTALIYLDNQHVHVAIFSGNDISYYRSIPKKVSAVFKSLNSSITSLDQLPEEEKDVFKDILVEIRRSFDYAIEHKRVDAIDHIVFTGTAPDLACLVPIISEGIHQTVTLASPFEGTHIQSPLESSISALGHELTVPVGLAISEPEFKLLPEIHRRKIARAQHVATVKKYAIIATSIAAAVIVLAILLRVHLQSQIENNQSTMDSIQASLNQITQLQQDQFKLQQDRIELSKIAGHIIPLDTIMHAVSTLIPEKLILTQFQYSEKTDMFLMVGNSYYDKGHSEQKLSEFITAIEDSTYFKDVRLAYFKRNENSSQSEFSIEVKYVKEGKHNEQAQR